MAPPAPAAPRQGSKASRQGSKASRQGSKVSGGAPRRAVAAGAAGEEELPEPPPEGGWDSAEEREKTIFDLKPCEEEKQGPRVDALLLVRNKATVPENWEPLWDDRELRAALMKCCEPPDPDFGKNPFSEEEELPEPSDLVRMLAFSVWANLATCEANRVGMREDPLLRNALVAATDPDRTALLRHRAFLCLSLMAIGGACADPSDDHLPSRPPTPRPCETCGLLPCVCHAGEKVYRNSDMEVCNAWMLGVGKEEPAHIRSGVLGALSSLAASSWANAIKLWGNKQVRQSVVAGAAVAEPGDVRLTALSALESFACCDHVQRRMWDDAGVRDVLLASAAANVYLDAEAGPAAQPRDVRCKAFGALANLATEGLNRAPMWRNRRLSAVVLQTVAAGGALRADALRVLVELTKSFECTGAMAEAGVMDLLAAAAGDAALGADDRRDCQFAHDRVALGPDGAGGALSGVPDSRR